MKGRDPRIVAMEREREDELRGRNRENARRGNPPHVVAAIREMRAMEGWRILCERLLVMRARKLELLAAVSAAETGQVGVLQGYAMALRDIPELAAAMEIPAPDRETVEVTVGRPGG